MGGTCSCGQTCSQKGNDCNGIHRPCAVSPPSDLKVINAQLLKAAREGDNALLQQSLRAGAEPETRHPMRMCPGERHVKRVPRRTSGLTPLMHAANGGYLTCVMALLEAKACVNAQDEDGTRALHLAASAGDLDVFKALLVAGADKKVVDKDLRGALDYLPDDIKQSPQQIRQWKAVFDNDLMLAC